MDGSILDFSIAAESNVHSPSPWRNMSAPPSCFVGNMTTSEPNMVLLRGVSLCDLKNAPFPGRCGGQLNTCHIGTMNLTVHVQFIQLSFDIFVAIVAFKELGTNSIHQ